MPRYPAAPMSKLRARSGPRPNTAERVPGAPRPPWRIGIDVGGTFTDLVLADQEGKLLVAKVPSTPSQPSDGVIAALGSAARKVDLSVNELLSKCSHFVHGSTVATNLVLERRGDSVGMLVTRGFRDSLQIRRGIRANAWDHRTPFPSPLVARHLRLPVSGRIDRNGVEIEPLSEADICTATEIFKAEGVRSVAVCLFNSFINDVHECAAADILRTRYPGVAISLSSRIAPIIGEYERASTTAVNAYVAPRVISYVQELAAELRLLGLKCPLHLVQNNGGALTLSGLEQRPAALLLSGPAAGIGALRLYGRDLPGAGVLSMEIGGTSCDVTLVRDGESETGPEFELGGLHVALPSIDIHSIGAGGGTIAHIDRGGMLVVGPRGAGAAPGPVCYGRGGEEPTVTDAQLVLGRLTPEVFGVGKALDIHRARDVISTRIAKPLGLSITDAAAGILKLLDQALVQAVQKLSAERGHDPRRFTLLAAGGAGPMHGASVGRSLNSPAVYVPRLAGTFCALGMLNLPARHEFVRATIAPLDASVLETLGSVCRALEAQATAVLDAEGYPAGKREFIRELDLRHTGQLGALRIAIDGASNIDLERVKERFLMLHDQVYGHRDETGQVEIAATRVIGVGLLPGLQLARNLERDEPARVVSRRDVYFEEPGTLIRTDIYCGRDLVPGMKIAGPAVIEEATTSILVGSRDICVVDAFNNFIITFPAGGPR
jgi:N-methylhydantoinase A